MKTGLKYSMVSLLLLCVFTACEEKQPQQPPETVKVELPPFPENQTEVIVKEIVVEKPYIPPGPSRTNIPAT